MTVRVKLGRNTAHRKAMFRTMVTQLFQHERILTTLPKAKQLRKFADRMITLAKRDTKAAKSKLCGFVRTEREQHKVITALATRYADRQGGYTRVLRWGRRPYDAAPMAYIELVDREGELRPARPAVPRGRQQEQQAGGFIPPAARAALWQLRDANAHADSSSSRGRRSSPQLLQLVAQLQQQRGFCTATSPFSSSSSSSGSGSHAWQQLRGLHGVRANSTVSVADQQLDSSCVHQQSRQQHQQLPSRLHMLTGSWLWSIGSQARAVAWSWQPF